MKDNLDFMKNMLIGFVVLCTSIVLSVQQEVFMVNQSNQTNFLNKQTEVENCLMSCYGIDQETAISVSSYFNELIKNAAYHPILKRLKIYRSNSKIVQALNF